MNRIIGDYLLDFDYSTGEWVLSLLDNDERYMVIGEGLTNNQALELAEHLITNDLVDI